MSDSKLTRAEQVRARAFSLAIETVAGPGNRTFHDIFGRAEEIEHWPYQAKEPAIIRASQATGIARANGLEQDGPNGGAHAA